MKKYEREVNAIIKKWGSIREHLIMKENPTFEKGETWNNEHKVINVLSSLVQNDGYKNGFQVDLVTFSICG